VGKSDCQLDRRTAVLWGELPPRSATANLRTYAHALRDKLAGGQAALDSLGEGYVLRVDADHCDYLRFEQLVQRERTVESLAEAHVELGEARLAARELSLLLADSPLRARRGG
jgi:DNA-binding SARP family transcriptional activator